MNILTFIKNLIKRGTVSRKTEDSGDYSIAQIKWMSKKVGNVEVLHPYGMSSYAPVGSLALMFNIMGQEANRAAIVNDPKRRFKDLKEGEVAIGNFLTRSYVKFLENGDIEIVTTNNQNITVTGDSNLTVAGSANITVTGDSNLTVAGSANITSTGNATITSDAHVVVTATGTVGITSTGNTTLTAPITTIDGALRVTGEITADYGGIDEISFTDIITKYNLHTHISATAGNPSSVASNTLP